MAATDHPARVTAAEGGIDKGARVWVKCIEVTASATPSAADLAADIEAGPGEDRRRRQIDRRRRAGRKIGREGRRSGESYGTDRCQEKFAVHVLVLSRDERFGKHTRLLRRRT